MPIKTRDGWKTKRQVSAQEAAWKKSRKHMIEKIGLEHLDDTGKVESRARSIFAEIDSDANGKIDQEELGKAMRNMGVSLSVGELTNMMKEADEDGDMLMDVDEFADLCLQEVKRYKAVTTSMCLMM